MDAQQLVERLSPFLKRSYLPLALGLFGLIFLAYGLVVLIGSSSNSSKDIVFEQSTTESGKIDKDEIVVDVEGAVVKPGVYRLATDSRVQEALVAAGGLSGSANRAWVARNLNLALKLKDGVKIYIPGMEETGVAKSITSTTGIEGGESQINLNTASASELDSLPGIGPVTSQKIIEGRPYNSTDELLAKKVVSQSVFEKIKERITIY